MYWGGFTVIIVSPWSLKVLTNMHKFSIIFCAVLLFHLTQFAVFHLEDFIANFHVFRIMACH